MQKSEGDKEFSFSLYVLYDLITIIAYNNFGFK